MSEPAKKKETFVIDCPNCEARVEAKFIAEKIVGDDYPDITRFVFLECPSCKGPILVSQDWGYSEYEGEFWQDSKRLWPSAERIISTAIPKIARESLVEAIKCYRAKAYMACAVMCGRTLEATCGILKTKGRGLSAQLKELLERKEIDRKIYEWGDALRKHRNIGAHASTEAVSKEDAKDLLDFAEAICEYVFVLNQKYSEFMKRQSKKVKSPGPSVVENQ